MNKIHEPVSDKTIHEHAKYGFNEIQRLLFVQSTKNEIGLVCYCKYCNLNKVTQSKETWFNTLTTEYFSLLSYFKNTILQ